MNTTLKRGGETVGKIVKIREQTYGMNMFWRGEILEDTKQHVVILDQKTNQKIRVYKRDIAHLEVIM